MADQFETETGGFDGRSAGSTSARKRGPSVLLLLAGVVALAVSAWAIAGGNGWPAEGAGGPNLGWVLVLAAIVVGAMLVFSPGKR